MAIVALTALISEQHKVHCMVSSPSSTCSSYASRGVVAFASVIIPDTTDPSAMWRSVATVTLATLAVIQPAALVVPIMAQVDILRERFNLPTFTFTLPNFNVQFSDIPRAIARIRMAMAVRNASELSQDESIHAFKLNGLKWHHKAISSHLRALERRAEEGKTDPHLEAAYQFVLAKVWLTYNSLEKEIFFPWMLNGTDGDERVIRTLKEFSVERDRIERSAERLRSLVRDCVTTSGDLRLQYQAHGYAYTGSTGDKKASTKLARALGNLAEDVERLHLAERQILFPIIAAKFPLTEQRAITNRMVDAMETRLSRLTLVNYFHMVKNDPVELEKFRDQVPGPVRALLGFWKASLYDGTPLEALNEEASAHRD